MTSRAIDPSTPAGVPSGPDPEDPSAESDRSTPESTGHDSSQTDKLIRLLRQVEPFHTPNGRLYATVPVNGHREVWGLAPRSPAMVRWLSRQYRRETGEAPSPGPLNRALLDLEARAQFDAPCRDVFVRVAGFENRIYLDLANDAWQVVEIDAGGWRLVTDPPVAFLRSQGQRPLPLPTAGGSLDVFRSLLPDISHADWMLLASCLVSALNPWGPYPVLIITGEQGSAKTTTVRLLRSVIDLSSTPTRDIPKDARDLAVAAHNSWFLAFDNLSHVSSWLSDALCRLATGGGFATRALYTDLDEVTFYAKRPTIITAINEVATRGDLLDRTVAVTLPAIPRSARRTEAEIDAAFDAMHPALLGALLDVVSGALAYTDVEIPGDLPRMADFMTWIHRACPKLGWDFNAFQAAYGGNRSQSVDTELDASPLTAPLMELAAAHHGEWRGTATTLLTILTTVADAASKGRRWPTDATRLSGDLRRLAPALRTRGIEVSFERENSGARTRLVVIKPTDDTGDE
jgi:hypothetical protein